MHALVLSFAVLYAPPSDPLESWVQAGAAFRAGQFAEAARLYRGIADQGYASSELFYDLGNAELRAGRIGPAIAAYLESKREDPRNEDTQANLRFARRQTQDAVSPPEPSVVARTLFFWHYALGARELLWALALVNAVFFGLLCARFLRRGRTFVGPAALVAGLALAALLGSFAIHTFAPTWVAVVQQPEAAVFAGIGEDAVVRFRLHEGTEAEVLQSEEGWHRIRLPDGQQGWVPGQAVALVRVE